MTRRSWLTRLLLSALLGGVGFAATAPSEADKQTLRRLLEKDVLQESLAGKRAYVSREPLPGGKRIATWRTKFQVPRKFSRAWFFFVDDMPEANWEHPCRYVFVDVKTRRYEVVKATTPPDDLSSMISLDCNP